MILGDLGASSYFNFSLWRLDKNLPEVEIYGLLACVHANLLQLCPTLTSKHDYCMLLVLPLLLLSHFSRVWLYVTLWTAAVQSPLATGFSRQEYWSGLPFPSPMHESEKWKWSRSVVSDSQWPHGLQPTRLFCPWDFPGMSIGICLFIIEF